MWADLLDHFKQMADDHSAPEQPILDGPIWFDPEILKETGTAFVNHKILPYAGGWMDQPRWWTIAMQRVYLPGLNWAKYEALDPEIKKQYHSKPKTIVIPPGGEW